MKRCQSTNTAELRQKRILEAKKNLKENLLATRSIGPVEKIVLREMDMACDFESAFKQLSNCYKYWKNTKSFSEVEKKYRSKVYGLCIKIAEEFKNRED